MQLLFKSRLSDKVYAAEKVGEDAWIIILLQSPFLKRVICDATMTLYYDPITKEDL